jgi:hypothetical protein
MSRYENDKESKFNARKAKEIHDKVIKTRHGKAR